MIQQSDALVRAITAAIDEDEEKNGGIPTIDAPMELRGGPPLVLNGEYVTAGTSRDLLCESASLDSVTVKLHWQASDDGKGNFVSSLIDMTFDASGHERDTMKLGATRFHGPALGAPFLGGGSCPATTRR